MIKTREIKPCAPPSQKTPTYATPEVGRGNGKPKTTLLWILEYLKTKHPEDKIVEIEYIVDLTKPAQCEISRNQYELWEHQYSAIKKKFSTYNPLCNIAFMFDTEKAYEVRIRDRIKKMTIEEIEEKLGHKVEVVSK